MPDLPQFTQQHSELLNIRPLENSNRIVPLDNPSHCYRVEEGEVSVYVARTCDGVPLYNRKKIHAFGAGEYIFPGSPPSSLDGLPIKPEILEREKSQHLYLGFFMIVGENDKLSVVDRHALLHHDKLTDHALFGVANWVEKITSALPNNTDLPAFRLLRFSGTDQQQIIEENICAQSGAKDEILWLQFARSEEISDAASTILANYRGLEIRASSRINQFQFPLFSRDTVVVSENVVVDIFTTRQLLQQGLGNKTVDDFHHLISVLLYLQALGFERQQQNDIVRSKEIEQQNMQTMNFNFVNAFHGKEDIVPYTTVIDRTSANSNLLLELCKISKSEVKSIATEILEAADPTTFGGLEHLLALGGFDKRKVTLTGKWYKKDDWTLVAFLEGHTFPVLLYYEVTRYKYYDPKTDEWKYLSDSIAEKITPEALLIYRRLSESVTSIKGFLLQALQLAHIDVKRILLTAVILGAITLVHPIILGKLLSSALPSFNFALLNSYLLALFAAIIGMLVANFFNSIAVLRIEYFLSLDIHAAIWSRLLRLPMTFFNRHAVGDLSSRANIFDDIQAVWTSSTANVISSSISVLFNLSLLFYYSWRLAFIIMAAFSLFFILTWIICRRVLPILANIFEYKGKVDGLIFQLLNGISKLRVAAKENTALALWSNVHNRVVVENRQYMLSNNVLQVAASIIPLIGSIIIFGFIYFGLLEAGYQTDFSLGDFILFNTAFGQLSSTMISLALVLLSVMSTIPMVKRMDPILQEPVEVGVQKPQLPSLRGDVRFNSVDFQYQPGIPILKNITLEIKEGEYAAIVGRSGSGKSTLFNLLLGFEQPHKGAVFVDDTNVNDIDLSDLRRRIGVVLQNGDLLPGSIYENIACEDTNVTLEAAWEAAEKAGMEKDIKDLPMGMHTLLSSFGGGGLSGGQLQRVMIARAISHHPAILLLDEATSALDNITQKVVQDSLLQMNITRIVIAHRLTTISNADRIYVMDQGEIVEQGSYEELLAKRGLFYELAIRQMQVE